MSAAFWDALRSSSGRSAADEGMDGVSGRRRTRQRVPWRGIGESG
jgi:hypothetical protein